MNNAEATPLLELINISKSYGDLLANDQINISVLPGEIHGLIGENGAGKSTLMKIVFGLQAPDSGEVVFQGQRQHFTSPADARSHGIAMVFQHFSLFDAMTVRENIALGLAGEYPNDKLAERITTLADEYSLAVDVDHHVHDLSVGEKQRIEILRCLLQQPKLLILDEPTSVLTPQESERLMTTLRRVAEKGQSVLFISHKLDEVRRLCDRVTVLRHGKVEAISDTAAVSDAELARLMTGETIVAPKAVMSTRSKTPRLTVKNLTTVAKDERTVALSNVSFDVYGGEVVGIAGVAGNGQRTLLAALTGEMFCDSADMIQLGGKAIGAINAAARRKRGICVVPEDRLGQATVPTMSLADNAYLTARYRHLLDRFGFILKARCRQLAGKIIASYDVRTSGTEAMARSLSGGNLQKFIIGREITQSPDVLIVAHPTWGVDAGATAAIRQALLDEAQRGAAVLVISQDLDELMEISHQLGVMLRGRLSALQPTNQLTLEQVGLLMGGATGATQ